MPSKLIVLLFKSRTVFYRLPITFKSVDTSVQQSSKSPHGKIILEGQLQDYTTAEPLSFATLFFPNTAVGMRSDIDGKFKFELKNLPSDTLYITLVGYAKKKVYIDRRIPYQYLNWS